MRGYDFEEERVKQEVLRIGAKRVLLQLPEGLKPEGPRLAKVIEKTGAVPIVSADPCYGACDLATEGAKGLGVDLIVHYGHSKLLKHERIPTIYVEARVAMSVNEVVEKALPVVKGWRRIGLATTVQHLQTLDSVRETLVRAGKTVVIGDAGRLEYPGQVIGCDYSNAKSIAKDVDGFLFIGGGRFHALGVALSTMKPTVVADPYSREVFPVDDDAEKIMRQRWRSLEAAQKVKTFGVLVGLKPGQRSLDQALQLKLKLETKGKVACLFAINEVVPEALSGFPSVGAYVNTACPRLSVEDAQRFDVPVLSKNEVLVMLGEMSWEELCRKGLFES